MTVILECGITQGAQALDLRSVHDPGCSVDQQTEQQGLVGVAQACLDDEPTEGDLVIGIGLASVVTHAATPSLEPADQPCEACCLGGLAPVEIAWQSRRRRPPAPRC